MLWRICTLGTEPNVNTEYGQVLPDKIPVLALVTDKVLYFLKNGIELLNNAFLCRSTWLSLGYSCMVYCPLHDMYNYNYLGLNQNLKKYFYGMGNKAIIYIYLLKDACSIYCDKTCLQSKLDVLFTAQGM